MKLMTRKLHPREGTEAQPRKDSSSLSVLLWTCLSKNQRRRKVTLVLAVSEVAPGLRISTGEAVPFLEF